MNRPPLFVLIAIGLLLLLPAGAGRMLLVLPVLLGGLGWFGGEFQVLDPRNAFFVSRLHFVL